MAVNLSVTFKLIDQISQRMENIANMGERAADHFSSFGDRADSAFERATSGSDRMSESFQSASAATAEYAEQGERTQQALESQAETAEQAAQGFEEYGREAEEAAEQSEEFGRRSEESSQKVRASAMDLRDALAAAGVVEALKKMAEAFNEFDEAADQFETAMAKVGTIADPTAASLESIQGQIQDLSKETGVAVADLSESVYSAISASVNTANAVDFVAQANALAVGGFTQTATAVDILTTALNAYQLEADQTQNVADMLIMTQNLGKTTVDELASSMGKVIPTAKSLNVDLDVLCGAYAVMTANGIATAETTTYLNSMLNELGKNGTAAADAFAAGTEHIKAGGLSMAEAGKAANVLWLNAEKVDKVIAQMGNSAGAANTAFEKMTDTGAFVEQKWQNALQNLKIAIGDAQPSLDGLMEKGTAIIDKLSDFVSKNPAIVGAIEGAALALGIFTAAVTAHTLAVQFAGAAHKALAMAMNTNPVFLMVTAVAALTAGLIAFISTCDNADSREHELTASSKSLSDEIARQEEVVASLEEQYGEANEKTFEAKARLAELKAEFEATSETVGEYRERVQASSQAVEDSISSYRETAAAIKEQQIDTKVLITELEKLQSQSKLTAFQQEYEQQIIEELNKSYPELGLAYDSTSGKISKSTEYLKAYCEQKAEEAKLEAQAQAYKDQKVYLAELDRERAEAQEALNAATERFNEIMGEAASDPWWMQGSRTQEINKASQEMQMAQEAVDSLGTDVDELTAEMDGLDESAKNAAEAVGEVGDSASSVIDTTAGLQVAMKGVFDGVSEQAEELAEAYKEAYDAAASAVDSSFGLFEKIELESSQTAEEISAALKSQAEYLDEYNANLEKAKGFGLDSSMIESLADGSRESASAIDTIIAKIESLGGTTDKAKEYIAEMNESFKTVQEAKTTLEETMVGMNATLKEKMEELKKSVEAGVEGLDLSEDAANAARETMNAYIKEIETQGSLAVDAATKVASSVSAALSKVSVKSSAPGHADGTTYGESVYIAGENGPELIVGREGSEVFPASETARILSAVMNSREQDTAVQMAPQEVTTIIQESTSSNTNNENKNLTLTIKGKGAIDIGQSVSRKDLLAFMKEELEGAIMNIIFREAYEEGEVAYEF